MRGPTRDLPTFIIAPAICCSNKQVVGALNPWRYIFASTKYRDRDRRRRLLWSIKWATYLQRLRSKGKNTPGVEKECFNQPAHTNNRFEQRDYFSLILMVQLQELDTPRILEKTRKHSNYYERYQPFGSDAFFFTVRYIPSISSAIQQLKIANKSRGQPGSRENVKRKASVFWRNN